MMIRVAFRYKDTRLLARLICLVQGGDTAHCEVAHQWDGGISYTCVSASWVDSGVREKRISLYPSKWRIYELPVEKAKVVDWFYSNKGKPYDLLGLMGFFIRRIRGSKKAWFCSEVAADILGLPEPHRYDLNLMESVCHRFGIRIQ